MGYRLQSTGEYFPTDQALRGTIPHAPFPITLEWMEANGIDPVFEGPQATGGTVYQYSQFAGIEQAQDGKWYTKYVLGPVFADIEGKTAAEQEAEYKARKDAEQASAVRQTRNQRLSQSDWTQLEDSTADKAAWATYRQALRDMSEQEGFPWTIQWPEQP
jgi:hypothetical protein